MPYCVPCVVHKESLGCLCLLWFMPAIYISLLKEILPVMFVTSSWAVQEAFSDTEWPFWPTHEIYNQSPPSSKKTNKDQTIFSFQRELRPSQKVTDESKIQQINYVSL